MAFPPLAGTTAVRSGRRSANSARARVCAGAATAALSILTALPGFAEDAAPAPTPLAQPPAPDPTPAVLNEAPTALRHVSLTVNKSRTLKLNQPLETAVVGQTDVADVLPMSDSSVYIQGKKVGTTNVSIFDAKKRLIAVIDLEVTPDTASLTSKIQASTGSRNIRATSSGEQVILSGEASDAVAAARAVAVAKGLNGEKVVDAMKVAQPQQVLLKVRFIEASRQAGRDLGFRFKGFSTGSNNVLAKSGQPQSAFPGIGSGNLPFGTVLANLVNNGVNISMQLDALEAKGLARNLAEPDLIALSGEVASFDAGGQIPVPVAQPGSVGGNPIVTIEYKKFGVHLDFTPVVLNDGLINVHLHPQVSEIDPENSVQISGSTVPTLTNREATTAIEMRSGQSFAIAGLLQTSNIDDLSQVPYLGNVPVLGSLFRSAAFQKRETDLIVIVTPSLIQPASPRERLATPLDQSLPANDVDLFLMGDVEARKAYTEYVTTGGGIVGPYGDIVDAGAPAPVRN